MGVSLNGGTPKKSKMIIFSRKNPWLLGKPTILGNPPFLGSVFYCYLPLPNCTNHHDSSIQLESFFGIHAPKERWMMPCWAALSLTTLKAALKCCINQSSQKIFNETNTYQEAISKRKLTFQSFVLKCELLVSGRVTYHLLPDLALPKIFKKHIHSLAKVKMSSVSSRYMLFEGLV